MGAPFLSLSLVQAQTPSSPPASALRRVRSSVEDLKGQRVAVVGLGKSGRAAARLALVRGASVLAIDKNEQLVPLENDPLFAEYAGLQTNLGYCDDMLLESADRIVVSPGVPLEEYGLSNWLHSGEQVTSELDFAAEVLPQNIKVLAVTGTNGKSTVTSFAGQMLHHLGIETFVGGNLGRPLSDAAIQCLQSSSGRDIYQVAVVEVSSYQMEIPIKYFSPAVSWIWIFQLCSCEQLIIKSFFNIFFITVKVAVVLNLTPDHLERHKTMQNYAALKCCLFSQMKHGKLAVLPVANHYLNEAFSSHANKCNVAWIGDHPGIKVDIETKGAILSIPTSGSVTHLQLGSLKAMGTHNYCNAAVAAFSVLGLDVGIDSDSINSTVEILSLLPHRMQVVFMDARGVTWVDDSKATNVESTYTGLMGLKDHKAVVLLGGLAKVLRNEGSNGFEQLVELLNHHRGVITFGSSGVMIQKTLCDGGLSIPCITAVNLEEAVKCARRMARNGDTILLSPGCASFDEFRNFEHRGKVFQELALSS
ncbi:UDP-N-acetylmuramoylalanine--D-glutamate ligase-like [Cocos nucifera]|uniref:UDP-N-acetylmuramoylalanine--D-glutamate ligase-like n=1 Tax=Cocos nucifera TaxID=13894 RepID=A0A8K0HV85_COCNU|nr:UDP-N-acetylmuramoylalanine--D-glutamate ligase-like [Cocos nucifera]